MAEDELTDSCAFGDSSDLGDIGVQRGHPGQGGTGEAVPLEVAEVGNVVDEDVSTLSEGDQIIVHSGVTGEHHRAVPGVETVCQRRYCPAVHHRDCGDPDNSIVEDDNRNLGLALSRLWDVDVDSPDERAGVGHPGVQWHDVQMVGVASEDVFDQVRRAGGW